MRALRVNHVSIHAVDLEASTRFYVEVFGMELLPSPDFEQPVVWLRLGDQQLHLFHRPTPAPQYHHVAFDVDDFEAAYVLARDRGLLDRQTFTHAVRELPGGAVQMYLRDPAGNLVEVNTPDVTAIDRSVVPEIVAVADERPQSAEARKARLYGPLASQ